MSAGRIEETFARVKTEGRTAFVAFVTVGYPEIDATPGLVKALIEGGADIIELGIPFSDPLAEGPTIQGSTFVALENGVTTETCLDAARQLRADGVTAPLIFMGYYNPILAYGIERFARDAAEAGADGIIPVDLPPEESVELHRACQANGLRLIYLLAPTSTDARIKAVGEKASGFVYCVSLTGVTGARNELPPELSAFLERVREQIPLPLAVGFGISQPEHFQTVGRIADAAVIGSAIIDVIARSAPSEREARLKHYAEVVTGRRGAAT
ncbi:MAG TPA: tryptophan synthase subunit alpha [Dehalococcoidia bacterium]|jgi:tryptophan synthase alpha chain|nr:tryptophan synthase subunit alpha [Dehalococcoidia bacterium]